MIQAIANILCLYLCALLFLCAIFIYRFALLGWVACVTVINMEVVYTLTGGVVVMKTIGVYVYVIVNNLSDGGAVDGIPSYCSYLPFFFGLLLLPSIFIHNCVLSVYLFNAYVLQLLLK